VLGAGVQFRVAGLAFPVLRDQGPVPLFERRLDRLVQPFLVVRGNAVDPDGYGVFLVLVQLRSLVVQPVEPVVDVNEIQTRLFEALELAFVPSLLALGDWREDFDFLFFKFGFERGGDFVRPLLGYRLVAYWAVRAADSSEQEPQVVVDFGYGPDGGTRVPGRGFLVNRDGRRQALNAVHIRLVHDAEELPGIGGEGFHIPALALGVERVKGERALPRPGETGYDGDFTSRYLDVDVLEVVLSCAFDDDFFFYFIT